MSRSRYRFCEPDSPHFMTCTIVAWLPVFATRRLANIIFESWQFLQNERSIDIIAYVLMENHLHWIATGPDLGKRVGEFGCAHAQDLFDQVVVKKDEEAMVQDGAKYPRKFSHCKTNLKESLPGGVELLSLPEDMAKL